MQTQWIEEKSHFIHFFHAVTVFSIFFIWFLFHDQFAKKSDRGDEDSVKCTTNTDVHFLHIFLLLAKTYEFSTSGKHIDQFNIEIYLYKINQLNCCIHR